MIPELNTIVHFYVVNSRRIQIIVCLSSLCRISAKNVSKISRSMKYSVTIV